MALFLKGLNGIKEIMNRCLQILLFGFSCAMVFTFCLVNAEELPARHQTLKIAHRGGRSDSARENTLKGCKVALRRADGVEVDVQISGDKTIWLSHSSRVHACDGDKKCFAETSDKEIENITTCNGKEGSYTRLGDLFKYMHEHHIRKPICLDIKETFPCSFSSLNIITVMRDVVDATLAVATRYDLTEYIILECEFSSVLSYAEQKNASVITMLNTYGNYEKGKQQALKKKLDGISFKYRMEDELTREKTDELHRNGLRLLVWNVPVSSDIALLTSFNVDFVMMNF